MPEIVTTIYRLRRKDGVWIWVQTKSRARYDPSTGEIDEIHCATRDVSAQDSIRELTRRTSAVARERILGVLDDGGPSMVFQPIVELETRTVVAVEALARFERAPERAPNIWFEEAWGVGLGFELELVAIGHALEALARLPEHLAMAVNASPETVQAPELIEILGDHAPRVVVEVTEHADIPDLAAFSAAVDRLRARGVRLAIDDVGTGFSGLSRLLELGPDIFKLDLSLTRDLHTDLKRGAMTTSLAAFGAEAGLDVIAEGIETEAELEALLARGVRYGQGYHLGRPAPEPIEVAAEALAIAG